MIFYESDFLLNFSSFRCILATDMAKHNEILNNYKSVIKSFDFKNQEHKSLVSAHIILSRTFEIRILKFSKYIESY